MSCRLYKDSVGLLGGLSLRTPGLFTRLSRSSKLSGLDRLGALHASPARFSSTTSGRRQSRQRPMSLPRLCCRRVWAVWHASLSFELQRVPRCVTATPSRPGRGRRAQSSPPGPSTCTPLTPIDITTCTFTGRAPPNTSLCPHRSAAIQRVPQAASYPWIGATVRGACTNTRVNGHRRKQPQSRGVSCPSSSGVRGACE